MILDTLIEMDGNVSRAAAHLGITDRIMGLRLKRYEIAPHQYRNRFPRPSRLALLALLASASVAAQIQTPADTLPISIPVSIFDVLAQPGPNAATVTIRQPESVRLLIGTRVVPSPAAADTAFALPAVDALTTPGYRVQIFAGNNRRTSRAEAVDKETRICELYPDIPVYVTYLAPFWRLRVGDLRTVEEARLLLYRLAQAFPDMAKDMDVVREDIRIPLP
jgi:hypothetical protein